MHRDNCHYGGVERGHGFVIVTTDKILSLILVRQNPGVGGTPHPFLAKIVEYLHLQNQAGGCSLLLSKGWWSTQAMSPQPLLAVTPR